VIGLQRRPVLLLALQEIARVPLLQARGRRERPVFPMHMGAPGVMVMMVVPLVDHHHMIHEDRARRPRPPEDRPKWQPPVTIGQERIVIAHVIDVRHRGLHGQHLALPLHRLHGIASQRTGGVRALSQRLHRRQYFLLLRKVGVAQVEGPLRAFGHALQQLRVRDERLDRRRPRPLLHRAHGVAAGHPAVHARPLRRLRELVGRGRGREHVPEHRVLLQGDRRQQRLELGLLIEPRLGAGRKRNRGASEEKEKPSHGLEATQFARPGCSNV
jgi:hypothetical protein